MKSEFQHAKDVTRIMQEKEEQELKPCTKPEAPQRFSIDHPFYDLDPVEMVPDPDGEYVQWDDVKHLFAD